jgi:hypothetical protein
MLKKLLYFKDLKNSVPKSFISKFPFKTKTEDGGCNTGTNAMEIVNLEVLI